MSTIFLGKAQTGTPSVHHFLWKSAPGTTNVRYFQGEMGAGDQYCPTGSGEAGPRGQLMFTIFRGIGAAPTATIVHYFLRLQQRASSGPDMPRKGAMSPALLRTPHDEPPGRSTTLQLWKANEAFGVPFQLWKENEAFGVPSIVCRAARAISCAPRRARGGGPRCGMATISDADSVPLARATRPAQLPPIGRRCGPPLATQAHQQPGWKSPLSATRPAPLPPIGRHRWPHIWRISSRDGRKGRRKDGPLTASDRGENWECGARATRPAQLPPIGRRCGPPLATWKSPLRARRARRHCRRLGATAARRWPHIWRISSRDGRRGRGKDGPLTAGERGENWECGFGRESKRSTGRCMRRQFSQSIGQVAPTTRGGEARKREGGRVSHTMTHAPTHTQMP